MSAVFLLFVWSGISGALREFPMSETLAQQAQSVSQGAYGLMALVCIWYAWRGGAWPRSVSAGWIVTCGCSAGLATVAWSGASVMAGVGTGVAGAAFGLGLIALLKRWRVRAPVSEAAPPAAPNAGQP